MLTYSLLPKEPTSRIDAEFRDEQNQNTTVDVSHNFEGDKYNYHLVLFFRPLILYCYDYEREYALVEMIA